MRPTTYPVNPKATKLVASFIKKLGQSVATTSLDGKVLYVTADECYIGPPTNEEPPCHMIAMWFDDGLQYRHLYAALNGVCGGSVRLIADLVINAEKHGPAFIMAKEAEISMLLMSISDMLQHIARRTRRAH